MTAWEMTAADLVAALRAIVPRGEATNPPASDDDETAETADLEDAE